MSADDRLVLGIDGGGTSTAAWLADAEGNILGRGEAGPSNVKSVGIPAGLGALEAAAWGAFADAGREFGPVAVTCLGLAGFDRPEDRRLLEFWNDERLHAGRLLPVNDGDLVVAAGCPEGWGLGVISGTGSIAVGVAPDGRKARAGGWGPIFGDEGSAYAVAIAGLRLTARRADGREGPPRNLGNPDHLTDRLCEAIGITDPADLIGAVYGRGMDRPAIAALAPRVVEAADTGDPFARGILEGAGRDLADIVMAAGRTLGFWLQGGEPEPVPLALAGGFLLNADRLRDGLLGRLLFQGPCPVLARHVPDPVAGAVVLARREMERS